MGTCGWLVLEEVFPRGFVACRALKVTSVGQSCCYLPPPVLPSSSRPHSLTLSPRPPTPPAATPTHPHAHTPPLPRHQLHPHIQSATPSRIQNITRTNSTPTYSPPRPLSHPLPHHKIITSSYFSVTSINFRFLSLNCYTLASLSHFIKFAREVGDIRPTSHTEAGIN